LSAPDPETRIERRGRAGWITLDRPRALNALTLGMVREIAAALDDFERDASVEYVVVTGAGERAFCAEEYILNRRIKRFPKPYVAVIDGIVMGGGVGLSMHGSHRVVGERSLFAMPEVGIGLFPDVGGTYLLPRLPKNFGAFLALTGLQARAGDLVALGLATSFIASADMAKLLDGLATDSSPLDDILARYASAPPASPLWAEAGWIEPAFAVLERGKIEAAVAQAAAAGSALAAQAEASLKTKSPTTQAIALRQLQIGGALSFEEAMRTEFRIASRVCRGHDFYEGVRAVIVDKDNKPQWRPAPGEPIRQADIDAYFAPLGPGQELDFGDGA
jgi:enoyl-CoA hydratase